MSNRHTLGLSDKIPRLSEIEEARALQYRCECIETACLQHGKPQPCLVVV